MPECWLEMKELEPKWFLDQKHLEASWLPLASIFQDLDLYPYAQLDQHSPGVSTVLESSPGRDWSCHPVLQSHVR